MATPSRSSRQNNHNEDEPQSIIQVSFLKSCCPPDLNISNTDHCVQREPLSFSNLLSTSAQSGDLQSSESSQSIQLSQIQTPIPSRRPCQRPSERPASYHISTPPPKRRFNAFPRIRRKRTFIADEKEMPPPPSKRPRVSIHKSSKSPSLSSIDENSTTMSPEPTLTTTDPMKRLPGNDHIEHNGSLPMSSRSSVSMSPIAKLAESNAKITGNSSGNSMKCAPETMSQPLSPTNSENKQNEFCSMNSKTDQIDQINKFNKSKPVKCTKSNTTKSTKTTKSKKSSKLKVHNAPLRRSARIRKKQQIESQSSTVSSPSVPTLPDYASIETHHRRNPTSSSSSTSNSSTTSNSFSFSIPSISTIHSISSRSSDWNDSVESSESAKGRQCTPTNSNSNSTSTSKSPLFGSMGKSLTASSTDRDDDMSSLSKPLSALNLQGDGDISMDQNELNQNDENVPNHSQSNKEWTDILSESVTSKWNAAATPIRSSLKKPKRPQQRRRRISWGQIECRNFEQRCGILSGGVPNSHGPSLHLGKLLTERTHEIDEWESTSTAKGVRELKVKERKQRVAMFSPKDLERKKLKMDREEISRLTKSRKNMGCDCLSIYKMKKDQIIDRILIVDKSVESDPERKRLKKLKKNEVLEILMKMQFAKYGRYDVCCVDESCECFRHGIECQIDSDCCDCGGDTVYNNFIGENWKLGKPDSSKKDSLSCGNPNGNTLKVIVTDHKGDSERGEHDVLKVAEDGFVKFKSPAVQKSIIDWNQHYEMNEDDSVCGVLNFD